MLTVATIVATSALRAMWLAMAARAASAAVGRWGGLEESERRQTLIKSWAGLGWAGLGWIGPDWNSARIGPAGLGRAGLGWGRDQTGLHSTPLRHARRIARANTPTSLQA